MTNMLPEDLWRDFPKTAPAFEALFASEEACRAYWIQIRWGGEPACARCQSKHEPGAAPHTVVAIQERTSVILDPVRVGLGRLHPLIKTSQLHPPV
jgi:hypothetical protein